MSNLYVVATPIGNLSDLTGRAIEILSAVPRVAAEDTRVTRKLLNHIGAFPKLDSLHEHTSPRRLKAIINHLESSDIAVVTDAGTPGISDPGPVLVEAAIAAGHTIVPVPGASAIITALSVTGWRFDRFLFLGFLPRKTSEKTAALDSTLTEPGPIVIYESPHRVKATFRDINAIFPDRQLVVCRELTKHYEEIFRGDAKSALSHFKEPRGEFAVVIKGVGEQAATRLAEKSILEVLVELESQGLKGRSIVDRVVEITGASKNIVYRLWLNRQ